MKDIFLWLYIADLMQVAIVVSALAFFAFVLSLIAYFIAAAEKASIERVGGLPESDLIRMNVWMRNVKRLALISIFVSAITAIMPTPKTIYMGLGFNVSGELINSETGQKALKALNVKLDKIIEESK